MTTKRMWLIVPSIRCRAGGDGFRRGQSLFYRLASPRLNTALGYLRRCYTSFSRSYLRYWPRTRRRIRATRRVRSTCHVGRVVRNNGGTSHLVGGSAPVCPSVELSFFGPKEFWQRCRWTASVHCPPSFPCGRLPHSYARNNKRRLVSTSVAYDYCARLCVDDRPFPMAGRKDVRGTAGSNLNVIIT